MTKSFFGGDLSKAHWAVGPKTRHSFHGLTKEERQEAQEENKRRTAAVRADNGKSTFYYQFRVADKAEKGRALELAHEHAERLAKHYGFPFDVNEGCFL